MCSRVGVNRWISLHGNDKVIRTLESNNHTDNDVDIRMLVGLYAGLVQQLLNDMGKLRRQGFTRRVYLEDTFWQTFCQLVGVMRYQSSRSVSCSFISNFSSG